MASVFRCMVTSSAQQTCLECPPRARAILRTWHADRSISESSARRHLSQIGSFRRYCLQLGLCEVDELTCEGARRFRAWCAQSRASESGNLGNTSSALRALRRVYEVMGTQLPPGKPIKRRAPPASTVLRDYATHLAQHRGNPEAPSTRSSTTSASCSNIWPPRASPGARCACRTSTRSSSSAPAAI